MSLFKRVLITLCFITINSAFAFELTQNMEVILIETGVNNIMEIRSNNTSVGTLYGDSAFNYSLYDSNHTLIRSFNVQTPFYDLLYTTIPILDENNYLLNLLYRKDHFITHSIYAIYSADNRQLATITSNISRTEFIVFGNLGNRLITLSYHRQLMADNPGYLIQIVDLYSVRNLHIDIATLLACIAREIYVFHT